MAAEVSVYVVLRVSGTALPCYLLNLKGHALVQVKRVRCEASGVLVAKDKAIKRFIVRNIVDASAIRDIQDCSVVDGAELQSCSCCSLRDLCWRTGPVRVCSVQPPQRVFSSRPSKGHCFPGLKRFSAVRRVG